MAKKKSPIEFWFDFSCPYSYLAAMQVEGIAEDSGRDVQWHPFLSLPAESESFAEAQRTYRELDTRRFARLYGETASLFPPPRSGLMATRAFYWMDMHHPEMAANFALSLYNAAFDQQKDIGSIEIITDIAKKQGLPEDSAAALTSALEQAAQQTLQSSPSDITKRLAQVQQQANQRGIFGAPWFVADGENFYGLERLWMVEEWLETGGW